MPVERTPRIFLARHGLTQANVDQAHAGLSDVHLLPQGREQAREMAERAASLPIRRVWASPLSRARETAEIVARRCGLPLGIDEDLRELDAGPWEGMSDEEIRRRFPRDFERWQADPAAFRLDGRETLPDAQRRIVGSLERIRARGECALVVTHNAALRLARVHYAGEELNCFAVFSPEHCRLFELRPELRGECLRPVE